jgi:hypothetical protein
VSREGIVAQASPQRKALRVALRYLGLLAIAVISFPISFIGTFMMNPLLGRLEAKYGIELTGHSGPADWIFEIVFGITTVVVFLFLRVAVILASGHHREST